MQVMKQSAFGFFKKELRVLALKKFSFIKEGNEYFYFSSIPEEVSFLKTRSSNCTMNKKKRKA